jgi:E3 ubiquitin-protein ligase RNF14
MNMAIPAADEDDERDQELISLSSIWPELVRGDEPYQLHLDLKVAPTTPIKLRFVASAKNDNGPDNMTASIASLAPLTSEFKRMPPLRLTINLPEGYPENSPPQVSITTELDWLPLNRKLQLESSIIELWEDFRSQILFTYIDSLQSEIDDGFGTKDALDVDPSLRIDLLDFQARTEKAEFNTQTFECGVCLSPKKGVACYKMGRCNHIFCKDCLVDFYKSCILEGDVARVQCMDFGCGFVSNAGKKVKPTIAPAELLQIPLDAELVQRYAELTRKKKIEADTSIVYCPRKWCQAPARSDKYPVLADLSLMTESEYTTAKAEAAPVVQEASKKDDDNDTDRLRICEKCAYAFCRVCNGSWHGDYTRCRIRDTPEMSKEEQANVAYIRQNTTECPVCLVPVQKSSGCNHMTCFQCRTHFCYICATWLDPHNPYKHFNKEGQHCYQRLWDLEEGDDGNGHAVFGGARAFEIQAVGMEEEEADMP